MNKLTIDRQKWLRGDTHNSYLLRPSDGKMCCLGFLGEACGIIKDQLDGTPSPSAHAFQFHGRAKWPEWIFFPVEQTTIHSFATSSLIDINDASVQIVSDEDREERIAQIFAQNGVEVEFIN